jgi:hypothetical protein
MKMRTAPVLQPVNQQQLETSWRDLRVFQQLFSLRVVDSLDLFIIYKVLFHTGMIVDLKAVAVKGVIGNFARDVMDGRLLLDKGTSIVRFRLAE